MRGVISAPIAIVRFPARLVRAFAAMRFSTVLAIATGGAAAFTAARRLLDRDDAPDELPEPLREPAARAQVALRDARGRLTSAIREANEERAAAETDLERDYLRRVGRLPE